MTKDGALQKIKELQDYIEAQDKNKVTIDKMVPGAVFLLNRPEATEPVTLVYDCEYSTWRHRNSPFSLYGGTRKSKGATKQDMFEYLRDNYTYLGTWKLELINA